MSSKLPRSPLAPMLTALPALTAMTACLVLLAGCGKQGPPLAPLRNVPAPVQDLAATQRGPRVLLAFTYPKTSKGGRALSGIQGIEVWEAVGVAPAAVTPPVGTATTAAAPSAAATTPTSPPTTPAAPSVPGAAPAAPAAPVTPVLPPLAAAQFTALGKKVLELKQADLPGVILGDRVVIDLPVPDPLPQPLQAHYYVVRTVGPDGDRSDPSNQAAIVLKKAPAPPETVQVSAQADGIHVTWAPVPGVLGYAIYRRGAQDRAFNRPVGLIPGAANTTYTDTSAQFGQDYIYAVTTVAERVPFLESAIQKEQEVRYADRFPPPAPGDVVALAEAGRVRLVWKTVEAADLAGYVVYRRPETQESFEKVTPQPLINPEFTDTDVVAGRTYIYRVRAVDSAGNESDPSKPAIANVP